MGDNNTSTDRGVNDEFWLNGQTKNYIFYDSELTNTYPPPPLNSVFVRDGHGDQASRSAAARSAKRPLSTDDSYRFNGRVNGNTGRKSGARHKTATLSRRWTSAVGRGKPKRKRRDEAIIVTGKKKKIINKRINNNENHSIRDGCRRLDDEDIKVEVVIVRARAGGV